MALLATSALRFADVFNFTIANICDISINSIIMYCVKFVKRRSRKYFSLQFLRLFRILQRKKNTLQNDSKY